MRDAKSLNRSLCLRVATSASGAGACTTSSPRTAGSAAALSYQQPARQIITVSDQQEPYLVKLSDDDWRTQAFYLFAAEPEGAEFLKTQLEREPSGETRAKIIRALERYFSQHPQEQAVLEKHIASDPDAAAILAAINTLRQIKDSSLSDLLQKRMDAAQSAGDEALAAKLRPTQLANYMWYGEIHLPEWAYAPPPVFEVKPAGQSVRVLAFGDFGTGSDDQMKNASAMRAYHQRRPFDFGLTLGDNFYGTGLSRTDNKRWLREWEELYSSMGIRFYPVFGNHDYGEADSPAAELAYSKQSRSWTFPAPYYTFTAGPVQFFAIDTVRLSDDQLHWLDDELVKSKARWKLVYGHYQIYSATRGDNAELMARLLPVLKKNSVDVWLNGHDHNLQELQPEGSLHCFVSGAGGAGLYEMNPTYNRSKFKEKQFGFTVIEADNQHVDMVFVNSDGSELYRSHITK